MSEAKGIKSGTSKKTAVKSRSRKQCRNVVVCGAQPILRVKQVTEQKGTRIETFPEI